MLYPIQTANILGIPFLKPYYLIMLIASILSLSKLRSFKSFLLLKLFSFYLPFLLLIDWVLLSTFWSVNMGISIKTSIKYLIYLFMSLGLGAFIYIQPTGYRLIAIAIYISSLLIGLMYSFIMVKKSAFLIFYENFSMETVGKIASINVGFGGGRNILASWLAFTLTFAYPILLIESSSRRRTFFLSIGAIFLLFLVFLTLSRTAIISILFFFFYFLSLYGEVLLLKNMFIT